MTTITIGGTDINYSDFEITVPVSTAGVAPTATVVANARESVTASDSVTIAINGETVFDGVAESGGTKSNLGGRRIKCEHRAVEFFDEEVSLNVTGRSSAGILADAQAATDSGSGLTLTVVPSGVTLDYSVENRPVKRVFRDICDRNGWVWWVDPATDTITVDTVGGRGTWQSLDAEADGISVDQFDSGNVDTVRNKVTVVGTGEQKVEATALDTDSRSTYGTRSGESPYNISYITTETEAANMANALLVPDPLAEGKITVPRTVGDIVDPLVNYTVDLTDDGKDISATGLLIEQQTIEQGRATLQIGQGNGESIAEFNRKARSRDDTTEPGTVLGSDRLADGSVDTNQLVDTAVIEQKLADASVTSGKLVDLSVTEQKLGDLSVSETKVQDDSIATPKLQAEAVTAAEIAAGTITATEIAAGTITSNEIAANTITADDILADTITATEMAAGTLTANEIDTLDLETSQLFVGTDADVGIDFDTASDGAGTVYARMFPTQDGQGFLGLPARRWFSADIQSVSAGSIDATGGVPIEMYPDDVADGISCFLTLNDDVFFGPTADNVGILGSSSQAWKEAYAGDSLATRVVPKDGSNTGNVGVTGNYWEGVRANAYFEESPLETATTRADIDLAELHESDWYDPPEYVAEATRAKQGSAEGGLSTSEHGDGSEGGVELGTMANYLLETCKAQQERLEAAEQQIDALESRLSDIEAQL